MIQELVGLGVFPDVAAGNGRFWMIARLGDPRHAGHVGIFVWEADRLDALREIARFAVPAGSPAFPRICYYQTKGHLWFAYHDGAGGILRNASTGQTMMLAPCQNNDPICFGSSYVAWQGAAADRWPITRMDLRTGERVAAGNGAGTGLSRVLSDGRVVLVDEDRQVVSGGTRPSWCGDVVVIEKHGNLGALARLEDEKEAWLWKDRQIVTPRCAYEYGLRLYAIAGWSESDGQIRVAVLKAADFTAAIPKPPDPPKPPKPPDPPKPPEHKMELSAEVKAIRDRYVAKFPIPQTPGGGSDHEERCRQWTIHLAEQIAHDRPNEGYGVKRADPNRPIGKDSLARQVSGRLWNFDLLIGTGTGKPTLVENPEGEDITGQVFVAVEPKNHLGTPDEPDKPDEPDSPPVSDDVLIQIMARFDKIDAQLKVLAGPRTYAVKSAHGYLSIQQNSDMEWNRPAGDGPWEQLRVEPKG